MDALSVPPWAQSLPNRGLSGHQAISPQALGGGLCHPPWDSATDERTQGQWETWDAKEFLDPILEMSGRKDAVMVMLEPPPAAGEDGGWHVHVCMSVSVPPGAKSSEQSGFGSASVVFV